MTESNPNTRLETFCDGVFAIAMTLLIIDIKIPSTIEIDNTAGFWAALKHIAPSVFAFILSFVIILITWVNHHNIFKLIKKSSTSFIYANGFLLLTVVFLPFPTSLLGEYLLTDHSAPAVVLYNFTLVAQAMGWTLLTGAAIKNKMCNSEKATLEITKSRRFSFFAFTLYSICAITAFWFPFTTAMITTITWIFWLIYSISIKHEEMN